MRALWLLALLASLASPAKAAPQGAPGPAEEVEVRLVQIAVSVIDPKRGDFASVPGLTAEQFKVLVDGEPLPPGALIVDEICGEARKRRRHPVFVLVDFNYLDGRDRVKVADALARLAGKADGWGAAFKIYSLTSKLSPLTAGLTADEQELRRAAERVRRTAFRPDLRLPWLSAGSAEPESAGLEAGGFDPDSIYASGYEGLPSNPDVEALIDEADARLADARREAESPRAVSTLAALEAIMRAYAEMPERKIILLFTSDGFRLPENDEFHPALLRIRELAARGFAIWTVDAAGLTRAGRGRSTLLTALANDTGGASYHELGDLARAFEGPVEQLSCYYLLSWKQAASRRKTTRAILSVRLRKREFPDLWGLRVIAPSKLALADPVSRLRGARVGALLAPDDYGRPRVAVAVRFPRRSGGHTIAPIFARVALSDLTWLPAREGGAQSRLLVDALGEIERPRGAVDLACRLGQETTGANLGLALRSAPGKGERAGLVVALDCPLQKTAGLLTAKAAVTDLAAGEAGGGQAKVLLSAPAEGGWRALGLHAETSSGRDFVWRPGMKAARRDRERSVFVYAGEDPEVPVDDRMRFGYLLCGPDAAGARSAVRHALFSLEEGSVRVALAMPPSATTVEGEPEAGPGCAPVRVVVPELTLMPGRYVFAVLGEGTDASTLDAERLRTAKPAPQAGLLAAAPFAIAAP